MGQMGRPSQLSRVMEVHLAAAALELGCLVSVSSVETGALLAKNKFYPGPMFFLCNFYYRIEETGLLSKEVYGALMLENINKHHYFCRNRDFFFFELGGWVYELEKYAVTSHFFLFMGYVLLELAVDLKNIVYIYLAYLLQLQEHFTLLSESL